jgi:formylglycine-generating enzyme required for sulfatase activity
MMGSPKGEEARYEDEGPRHPVTVAAFDIAQTEVTVAQYRRFRPGRRPERNEGPEQPATNLNWGEAQAYCEHYGYRLPTEAEWEFAARGGSDTPWSFGSDSSKLAGYAWYLGNSDSKTHAVGEKAANPFGLADMHGNVWEWCQDWYASYEPGLQVSPTGPESGTMRVLRGGSAWLEPRLLRSAFRDGRGPGVRLRNIGFRCARARRQP